MAVGTWLAFGLLALQVVAVPSRAVKEPASSCSNPRVRKEWRSLTIPQRKAYIGAVQCMMNSPSKHKQHFPLLQNRYDDFVALHANSTAGGRSWGQIPLFSEFNITTIIDQILGMAQGIHGTGVFMPWHRYMLNIWEDTLINECKYNGTLPYWDYYLDTPEAGGNFAKSPLFDPEHGFGGNGANVNLSSILGFDTTQIEIWIDEIAKQFPILAPLTGGTGGGCVTSGPFKNRTLHIGPLGYMAPNNTRCLTRMINPRVVHTSATKRSLGQLLRSKDMTAFRATIEGGEWEVHGIFNVSVKGEMHGLGHGGVGGEMGDPFNSVNDPLFFLHHAGMDRMWSLWQEQDPEKRTFDAGKQNWWDFSSLTLDTMVWMGSFAPDRKASEVFDTLNRNGKGILCYKYDGLPPSTYMD